MERYCLTMDDADKSLFFLWFVFIFEDRWSMLPQVVAQVRSSAHRFQAASVVSPDFFAWLSTVLVVWQFALDNKSVIVQL